MALPEYEVYAVRYATVARKPHENFITPDIHDGPMSMDYFVWAIVGRDASFVVDTGFDEEAARRRKRNLLICPATGLEAIGIRREQIADIIVTHLHYDHAGNLGLFPNAVFHLQDDEMAYATGRHMGHHALSHAYDVDSVVHMVRNVYAGRVRFHRGDAELAPGVTIHRVGGHTAGLQVVRVHTRRGWVVLASDASHYYANIRRRSPFPIVFNVGDMLEAYRIVERLADSPDHIIPGHDPEVLAIYPRLETDKVEAAILHGPPKHGPRA
jgi:glyoxylase-like metal-dependent hydrolase (beta-lactamase superfamily II)